MGFSRQEYWSGLPFPSPGDLPNPGIKSRSPALQADTLTSEPPKWHQVISIRIIFCSSHNKILQKISTEKSQELWNSLVYITSLIKIAEEIRLLIIYLDIRILAQPSTPAASFLYPASNLDWRFISYMILYMILYNHQTVLYVRNHQFLTVSQLPFLLSRHHQEIKGHPLQLISRHCNLTCF